MTHTLPYEVQNSIKFLLRWNTSLCSIKKMYSTVGMATLSKMIRNNSFNGPRGIQEYLRSMNISMSLSGTEKLLNGKGFKAKRKSKTSFVSAANKKLRVNMWGSDSKSFSWSDVPRTNRPHQFQLQVQGSDDRVTFWGCISGDGLGYGTTIIDGTIDSNNQNESFVDKILDWLPQNSDLNPIDNIRDDLKRHLDTSPNRPATK
ncbi:hypothetical protein INT46_007614 [Mucor plumbeus]|uniref:Uncharacterized protein n=1 Tax=Mucor plumbeus TaxID=97098 RepID=A0A8H7QJI1_9FUNG|nr:hypothetical protein INT46_007614 [Mucor plumbeus]